MVVGEADSKLRLRELHHFSFHAHGFSIAIVMIGNVWRIIYVRYKALCKVH